MNFRSWVRSIFSEPNGNGSTTRVLMGLLFSFILGAGTAFAVATYQKKITLDQFDGFLSSAGIFLVTACGPLYALNKAADVLKTTNSSTKTGE